MRPINRDTRAIGWSVAGARRWRPRNEIYLAKLPAKPPQSLLVSLADKTHNAEAILFDYRVLGDSLWDRFNGGGAGSHCYYRSWRLLAHGTDRCEHPDIAVVPIGAQTAAGCQFVVTEPLSAKVPNGHATTEMEERRV